ncbi:MAG: ABC transporter substrate-binding protein [Burkholderiaceae bacterium]|nr:ABC transporter substrate-binding protein [Burkholderiaceae bacterium]
MKARHFAVVSAVFAAITFTAASGAVAADKVPFGVITPLSGGAAHYGTNFWRGIQMAAEEINKGGGVSLGGKKAELEPIVCDDEFKSDKSVNCARRLESMHHVPMMMTPASLSAFPIMGFNEKMGFLLMATSQSPSFTEKGNKMIIRIVNNVNRTMDGWLSLALTQLSRTNVPARSVAIMEVNTQLGKEWVQAFEREWKKRNLEIVATASYDANETDFTAQLSSLLAKKPDLILLTTVDEPSSLAIKQARQLGFKGTFLNSAASSGEKILQLLPPDMVNGTIVELPAWALNSPAKQEFEAKYKAKYNNEVPHLSAGLGYEGVRLFARALEKAGSTDPVKIRRAFPGAYDIPNTIFNMGKLDEKGDVDFPMYLGLLKDGKVIGISK